MKNVCFTAVATMSLQEYMAIAEALSIKLPLSSVVSLKRTAPTKQDALKPNKAASFKTRVLKTKLTGADHVTQLTPEAEKVVRAAFDIPANTVLVEISFNFTYQGSGRPEESTLVSGVLTYNIAGCKDVKIHASEYSEAEYDDVFERIFTSSVNIG